MSDSAAGCPWPGEDDLYRRYHDTEWGVPEYDSRALWEKLILDGFQAGLSWITILRKRDSFRAGFAGFDPIAVSQFTQADVERLVRDPGIVRHRGKIEAAIKNARAYLEVEKSEAGGFSSFVWGFVGGHPIVNQYAAMAEVPASTPTSLALSKALKQRGFAFVGPTIVYAWMQACGLVNDHMKGCPRHQDIANLASTR